MYSSTCCRCWQQINVCGQCHTFALPIYSQVKALKVFLCTKIWSEHGNEEKYCIIVWTGYSLWDLGFHFCDQLFGHSVASYINDSRCFSFPFDMKYH